MEIEYLNSILYLQYNTIAEEAHSHPVCEVFFVVISIPTRWTLACEHLINFGKYPLKIFLTMLFLID